MVLKQGEARRMRMGGCGRLLGLGLLWMCAMPSASAFLQDEPTVRIRGRRIETRESMRRNEIVLEGLKDDAVGTEGTALSRTPRPVDEQERYERALRLLEGDPVLRGSALPPRTSDAVRVRGAQGAETDGTSEGAGRGHLGALVLLLGALMGLILWMRARRSLAPKAR